MTLASDEFPTDQTDFSIMQSLKPAPSPAHYTSHATAVTSTSSRHTLLALAHLIHGQVSAPVHLGLLEADGTIKGAAEGTAPDVAHLVLVGEHKQPLQRVLRCCLRQAYLFQELPVRGSQCRCALVSADGALQCSAWCLCDV